MIRQMKEMIKNGVIGDIQRVDLQYYQGWINQLFMIVSEDLKLGGFNLKSRE
ncbi:MAG: hypothetical protein CM15mP102_19580 [Flavobacteriales bacterium]|nr:MAG: hypothetical protein CM15mP102_19580 [Flavobacteriales bacterium]